MFGSLPRYPQAAESHTNGFVADQAWRQALGEADLGGQRERPPARGLAERPWTLVQQGAEGLAGPRIENSCYGVRSRGEGLQHREAAVVKRMNGIADGLLGAPQVVRNRGGRLALGTGEEDLAAADGKGGRGPEPGLQSCPLVRRERAYK
jgi:hypothetical protein